MNFIERAKNLLVALGAEWVLWLLVAASILSVAVIVERLLVLRSLRIDGSELRALLVEALRSGGTAKAREVLSSFLHPAAQVALRGLERAENETNAEQAEGRMNAEIIVQRRRLEQRFAVLASLGANAPFIGLFGTVIGILKAFDALGSTAAQASAAMAPQTVMSAIAESLVATAVGLGVAIPAILAFNAFQKVVKASLDDAQVLALEVIAHLQSPDSVRARSSRSPSLRQVS
ncbi:MAG: MotA/TolQ/ExbB proton channel family protein [Polyangiaceae bacterium]